MPSLYIFATLRDLFCRNVIAILVGEHNLVPSVAGANTVYQQIKHMRAAVGQYLSSIGQTFEDDITVCHVPEDIRKAIMSWCNIQTTKFIDRVKLALLPEEAYTALLEVFRMFRDYELKDMKRPAKLKKDDQGIEIVKELPIQGLESLLRRVPNDAFAEFLSLLVAKEEVPSGAKAFGDDWILRKGTLQLI